MSYTQMVDGLHERFATLGTIKSLQKNEPSSVQTTPTLYSLLDSFKRHTQGQVTTMTYRILNRLLVKWQDNKKAEEEMTAYVNALAASIEQDPYLGGRTTWPAKVTDGEAVFVNIGGTTHRALDVYTEVTEEGAYAGGI